jgi:hypothetical protein
MGCFQLKALRSRLSLPPAPNHRPLWPQDARLLDLKYQERNLNDYDPDTRPLA